MHKVQFLPSAGRPGQLTSIRGKKGKRTKLSTTGSVLVRVGSGRVESTSIGWPVKDAVSENSIVQSRPVRRHSSAVVAENGVVIRVIFFITKTTSFTSKLSVFFAVSNWINHIFCKVHPLLLFLFIFLLLIRRDARSREGLIVGGNPAD